MEDGGQGADERSELFALFERAVGLSGAERDSFLADLRRRSPALAAELAELLAQDAGGGPVPHAISQKRSLVQSLVEDLARASEPGPDPPSSAILAQLAARAPASSRYSIQGELARGGMGAILRVWDEDLGRSLAMKVALGEARFEPSGQTPPVDARTLARFLAEAQVTGQLDHPGIVPVHELGMDRDGRVYFTMRLVKGRHLGLIFDRVKDGEEGWTQTRALGVLLKVCEAMAYAHANGIVHRDLKPSNVMVGRFGEVYVMDWGLARARGKREIAPSPAQEARGERGEILVTREGSVLGTPGYMAPEQAAGRAHEVDERSDVYALGAMLYELLSGDMPYRQQGEDPHPMALIARILDGPPKPLATLAPDAPAELVAICEKAMARERLARYREMGELGEDLRAFLEGRVVHAYETGAWAEARKWVRRNRRFAGALAAGILALVAGLSASLVLKRQSDRNAVLAAERGAVALANASLADEQRKKAEESAGLAEERRVEAEQKADEVLRLSAFQRLADLEAEADRLWPAEPELVQTYTEWLERARALVAGLEPRGEERGHRARLVKLRERAIPLSAEERDARRSTHPRFAELVLQEKKVAVLRAARDARAGQAESASFTLDPATLPADAGELEALARVLVEPGRTEYGREAEGLALARLAIERVEDDAVAARAGDTLAWALLANGLDELALQESAAALEAAPEGERSAHEESARALREAVKASGDGSSIAAAEAELAALEVEVGAGPEFRFANEQDAWWHAQLQKLIAEIEAFANPENGLIAGISAAHGWGIERRRDFAASIAERSIDGADAARSWAEAIASIADPAQCPRYGGMRIVPQLGLLPLGRDPDSGLWEFAHLQTGDPARRGADGKLAIEEETGLVFVLLPGGTFTMGAQASDPAGSNFDPESNLEERPPHAVSISPYFLSKYEMTQGQWQRLVGRNPSYFGPHHWESNWSRSERGADLARPVEQVSWPECVQVLARLGLELPSEAQWEYGARAGTTTVRWTGNGKESLQGAANVADSYARAHGGDGWVGAEAALDDGNTVHARVGSYRANGFGLHDVLGNCMEWCRDGYDETFYVRSPRRDPVAPSLAASARVIRGGGFDTPAPTARSAARTLASPSQTGNTIGLRPARAVRLAPISTMQAAGR